MNQLTEREIEIMNLVISPSITNACVSNIYHKLDYKNRVNSAINK